MPSRSRAAFCRVAVVSFVLGALFAPAGLRAQGTGPEASPTPLSAPPLEVGNVSAPGPIVQTIPPSNPVTGIGVVPAPGDPLLHSVTSHSLHFPHRAGLHDRITVEVKNIDRLLAQVGNDCTRLILFIDGVPLTGTPPESCNPLQGRIRFELDRTDESDNSWHALLGSPTGFIRKVPVSIGPTGGFPILTEVRAFELRLLPTLGFYGFLGLLGFALLVFLWLSRRTSLLRDPGPPGALGPFNLGRIQLAFWFFLVVSAFVFIWLVTREVDSVTGSVVALLGIGSGTALGSAIIDSDRRANPNAVALPVRTSSGLLRDVIRDDRGKLSFYNFQLAVWTLVLGIIFCVSVYDRLSMPQFNGTLLALLGISSGTFLGAKGPGEK
ncbi:MAG TPA: hypothetical protein VN851_08280 [Thermoanaerobaculia bacterium]|nr:hypothetical protein [Thermoanaerobaculia bacterium]